jgi:hypothetical protein
MQNLGVQRGPVQEVCGKKLLVKLVDGIGQGD